jgi:hypothetical protein
LQGFAFASKESTVWISGAGQPQYCPHNTGSPVEGDQIVRHLSPAIRCAETPDGRVLFDRDQARILCLNSVASTILGLALQGLGEEEIAGRIAADYVIDADKARADVHEFLESLDQYKIFQARHEPAVPRTDT